MHNNKTQGYGRIVMKKLFICLILATLGCSSNSQSKSVVLDSNKDIGHIYLNGTVTVSGDHSVVYLGKDDYGFRQVDNEPFTFYSEICCSYAFGGSFGGYGGKIFNVSNKTARMRVTCIDGEGLANNVLIIDVKPRTFSRIMFKSSGEAPAICRKIKCELIRLY